MCRSYEHFCACGKQLDKRFEALGATRIAERVDVNREDLAAIDQWLSGLTTALPSMALKTCQQLGGKSALPCHKQLPCWLCSCLYRTIVHFQDTGAMTADACMAAAAVQYFVAYVMLYMLLRH